jgi:hypothetical protein
MNKKTFSILAAGALVAGVSVGAVTTQVIAAAATADIPYEGQVGGGAPFKIVEDNDVLRATLISMPKGQMRQGGVKRKTDQILIYIDDAKYSHLATPGTQFDRESQTVVQKGKVTWHDKDTVVGTLRVDEPYRVMYVELKRPKPIGK